MKLEGKISILIGRENISIEIEDENANTKFVRIKMSSEQFCRALSREMHVECDLEVDGLEKVGKTHENKSFVFEIPSKLQFDRNDELLNELAIKALNDNGMSDWIPDRYYGSQSSFFKNEDKHYARVTIRRWIAFPDKKTNPDNQTDE